MPELLKSIEKVDDHTVRFTLDAAGGAVPRRPRHAVQHHPVGRIRRRMLLQAGTPEKLDAEPIGTGPFAFVGFQPDVAVRYRAFDDYWARQAADRHAGLLDHAERRRAPHQAEGRRMPRHGVSQPGRPRRDRGRPEPAVPRAGGAQHRLSGDEHARSRRSTTCACGARSTWRSTRRRSSRRSIRAPASSRRTRSRRRFWSYNDDDRGLSLRSGRARSS